MLFYCHIKLNPTIFKSFTGLNVAEFEDLLPYFERAWDEYREETFVKNKDRQRKPRGKELTLSDRWMNHLISKARITVEHVIAGVKRSRIVKDVFRNTRNGYDDLAMEIACGLHNNRTRHRNA